MQTGGTVYRTSAKYVSVKVAFEERACVPLSENVVYALKKAANHTSLTRYGLCCPERVQKI